MYQTLIACFSIIVLSSCGSVKINQHASSCVAKPATGLVAAFDTPSLPQDQRFWVAIDNQSGIDEAINSWKGATHANIPIGALVCQSVAWNCGWSWYMDPQTVGVTELAIEACDAHPFPSKSACEAFIQASPNGYYCPWSAKLVELRDCRTDATCPMLAH